MSKNWIKPDMSKFAMFILSHGRPEYHKTIDTLAKSGYHGNIVLIVDDQDKRGDDYIRAYGNDKVYVFNKEFVAQWTDTMNNFGDRRASLFARNACFGIAKELGYDYFCVMDDDTESFAYKQPEKERISHRFGEVCEYFVEYLINTPLLALAFSQGGDHIGGYDPERRNYKRKCMNSWFCMTNRPFRFYGVMNDDINACIQNGIRGGLFLTIYTYMLHQPLTQTNSGGVTETYLKYGTYVKSFYSVMIAPASIKICMMGQTSPRLHHKINYETTYPCIISEEYKK